jgi:predicted transcriptional regulator
MPGLVPGIHVFGMEGANMLSFRRRRQIMNVKQRKIELDELDRQWAAIKAGEPTVAHDDVVRWLDTWGAPSFRPWRVRR